MSKITTVSNVVTPGVYISGDVLALPKININVAYILGIGHINIISTLHIISNYNYYMYINMVHDDGWDIWVDCFLLIKRQPSNY